MTAIVSFLVDGYAALCWDSAVSREHPPMYPESSFGENQVVGTGRVEEAVLKVCNVNGLPVLVAGDVARAKKYCAALEEQLAATDVREAVFNLRDEFRDSVEPFTVVVADTVAGQVRLTRYRSDGHVFHMEGHTESVWIDGSLPDHLCRIVRTGTLAVRKFPLTTQQRLLALLAFMQSIGVSNYLPEYGVGGAFCGALYDGNVSWQEPLQYLFTGPERLNNLVAADGGEIEDCRAFDMVRCVIGDWTGAIASSLVRRTTILRSPTDYRSTDDLVAAALRLRGDNKWVSASAAYAFISVATQRVVIAFPRQTSDSSLIRFRAHDPTSEKFIFDGFISHRLEQPLSPLQWSIEIIIENAKGEDPSVFAATLDLDVIVAAH